MNIDNINAVLHAEIERLRKDRDAVIEECALVAESYQGPRSIADAIRKLKESSG